MHTATPMRFLIGDREINLVDETCAGMAMTEMDCALLTVLASRNGETATKAELYREVWGYRAVPRGRALDFAIGRLRDKIEPDRKKPIFLQTVRGRGFRLHWKRKPLEIDEGVSFRPPGLRTEWVGTRDSIRALQGRLGEVKVLTLLGPAGVGKTRLLSETVGDDLPLHWLRLHDITDEFGLLAALCQAYQVSGVALAGASKQLFKNVAQTLKARETSPLLVLDGAEGLTEALRWIVPLLVDEADLKVVVTTRIRLELQGEEVFEVAPLSMAEALVFMRVKADAVLGLGRVTDAELEPLVSRLDGLPLAMELAVPRLRALRPDQLVARLAEDVQILKDAPGLSVSLPSLILHSVSHLDDAHLMALWTLSMLNRGVTIEMAEGLLAPFGDPLSLVSALIDHSLLLRMNPKGEVPRFRVLGSVATTVRNALRIQQGEREGEVWATLCAQAAKWCRANGTDAVSHGTEVRLRHVLREEFGHAERWLGSLMQAGLHDEAVQLTWSFATLMEWEGDRRRCLQLCRWMAERVREDVHRGLFLMYGASNAAHAQDWETVDRFQERAWSLRAESGALRAYFYLRKIEVSRLRGEYSSMEDCYAEVLTHAHPEKDVDLLARFYLLRTAILALKADNEASKEDLKQAWVYAKKGPSAISRSECFLNEAYHHYREGNADDAAFAYRRAIRLLTPLRPSALLAGHYRRLSHALTAAGDASGAARARQEAMGLVHRDANPTLFARLLSSDAIYYRSRDADHALELMKEALNLSRQGVDRHTKLSVYQRAIHLFLGQDGLYPFFDILDEMELLVTDSEDGFFLADVYCVRGYLAAEAGECARALRFVELAWSEAQPFEGQVEIPGLLAKLALVSVLAGDSVRGKDMLDRLDAYSGQIWEGVAAGKYATRARELLAAGAS